MAWAQDASFAPPWARWRPSTPFSVGVEEEVMLLHPADSGLAQRIDDVLPALSTELADRVSAETHQAAIEIATHPHATAGAAVAELRGLRGRLATELETIGVATAAAGTHPTTVWQDTRVSPSARHQLIDREMGELARREPTFALHVHIGVAAAEDAIRLMNRLRAHLPMLLALSANSPFWQGRDSRLASVRTPLFATFPRTGIPRRFASFADWQTTVDLLIRAGAIAEPTFLWWDVRPQPRYGTVEVRVMDAQSTVGDTAALVALVQSIARLELLEGYASDAIVGAQEVLEENRFIAARDGVDARLIDVELGALRPLRDQLEALIPALRPHAVALGCLTALDRVPALVESPGAARQRALAASGIDDVAGALSALFVDDH